MYQRAIKISVVLIFLGLWLSGCVTLSTFQTAEVLPAGKVQVGAGASGVGQNAPVIMEVSGRVGLGKNLDAGAKFTLLNTWSADIKWQPIKIGEFLMALDVAGSIFKSADENDDLTTTGVYPALILGGTHWYAGGKWVFLSTGGTLTFFGSQNIDLTTNFQGAFIGLSIGKKFRLVPEANFYFPEDNFFIHWGLGLQWRL